MIFVKACYFSVVCLLKTEKARRYDATPIGFLVCRPRTNPSARRIDCRLGNSFTSK